LVICDFVCGLEDCLAPGWVEGVCLFDKSALHFKRNRSGLTSLTTSLNSSSISFSALRNRCHKSSPTEPRCNNDASACLEFLICTIRRISSVARRRRAALRVVSGMAGSPPSSGASMWRRERYTFRCTWGPNHGAREAAFARRRLVIVLCECGEGMRRTGLSLVVEG
jgi:hypothetical protein